MFISEQGHYMFDEFNDDMYCAADEYGWMYDDMSMFVTYLIGA